MLLSQHLVWWYSRYRVRASIWLCRHHTVRKLSPCTTYQPNTSFHAYEMNAIRFTRRARSSRLGMSVDALSASHSTSVVLLLTQSNTLYDPTYVHVTKSFNILAYFNTFWACWINIPQFPHTRTDVGREWCLFRRSNNNEFFQVPGGRFNHCSDLAVGNNQGEVFYKSKVLVRKLE